MLQNQRGYPTRFWSGNEEVRVHDGMGIQRFSWSKGQRAVWDPLIRLEAELCVSEGVRIEMWDGVIIRDNRPL